jgi:hypothetical protein
MSAFAAASLLLSNKLHRFGQHLLVEFPVQLDLRRLSCNTSCRRHQCMFCRSGQKLLVRDYLTAGRRELQDTLAELQALMEVTGEYQE